MENQNNLQQEETLSQESLQSLEEEQLHDVIGGGWEKVLACFTCGAFQQRPAHHGTAVDIRPDSPIRRSFSFPPTAVNSPDSPALTHFIRSASMSAK